MKYILALLFSSLAAAPARADLSVVHTADADLNVGARMQLLGFGQSVNDPVDDHARVYLFMKEARLRTNGRYHGASFNVELALGGEESIVATTGVSLGLLDLSANIPLPFDGSYLKVGQFKVPYGRERLTYSGNAQFIDRSVQDLGFRVGRDVGAALTLHPGLLTLIGGVFTGGGRDVPPNHYLPEKLGIPELVVRAGFGNVDDDAYALKNDLAPAETKAAFFVNALYTKDSIVGHSTVLNVKLADKPLLLNGNWNQYIGQHPLDAGTFWQLGADAALRTPLGAATLSAEAEVNWAGYSNKYGVAHNAGGRIQAGVGFSPVEIALRYAVLFPEKNFAAGAMPITGGDPIHEITPSIAYFFDDQRLKLVADVPMLLGTPVVTEPKVGQYVATELPDQTAVLTKGGSIARQNVIEARLMLQAAF